MANLNISKDPCDKEITIGKLVLNSIRISAHLEKQINTGNIEAEYKLNYIKKINCEKNLKKSKEQLSKYQEYDKLSVLNKLALGIIKLSIKAENNRLKKANDKLDELKLELGDKADELSNLDNIFKEFESLIK